MKSKRIIFIIMVIVFICSTAIFAQNDVLYKVRKGDTLSKIASKYDVGINELIKENNIKDPNYICIGQKLVIPTKNKVYNVKAGDTLAKIAGYFKVSLSNLIEINGLDDPDKIYKEQDIIIPVDMDRNRYTLASRNRNPATYIWPVQGIISSYYGWRIHPIRKKKQFHTGIDIAVPQGTPIYAAKTGEVIYSGWADGYGYLVIINHNDNSQTYYAHNLDLLVKKGDTVRQGKIISLSGTTGVSTGPHLHFEIRKNGRHLDPLQKLNYKYMENEFKI